MLKKYFVLSVACVALTSEFAFGHPPDTDRDRGGNTLFDTLDEAKSYADEQNIRTEDKKRDETQWQEDDKKDKEAKAERENIDGFGNTLKPHHKGKAIKDLNKQVRINGVVDSIKNHVRKKVEDGETTSWNEEDKIQPMKRRAFNNATQAEQDAHAKRVREAGKKITYQVGNHDLGKTAHDYANYLINKKNEPTEETKPVLPDTGATNEGAIPTEGNDANGQDNSAEQGSSTPEKEKSNNIDPRLDERMSAMFMADKVRHELGDTGKFAMIPRQEILDDSKDEIKKYESFLDCLKAHR